MIKKLLLTTFLLTGAFFASASAQTNVAPEKQAAIKELVRLMQGDNNIEEMMRAMIPQMQQQNDAILQSTLDTMPDLTAAEKKAIAASVAADKKYSVERFMERMMQKINYAELLAEISYCVYDKHFTLAEINDLTAFYKSPTGQKFIKTMTPLMTDMMTAIQERVVPKMMIVIKEMTDEDKAEIERQVNTKRPRPKKNAGK